MNISVDENKLDRAIHKLKVLLQDMKTDNTTLLKSYHRVAGAIRDLYDAIKTGGDDG